MGSNIRGIVDKGWVLKEIALAVSKGCLKESFNRH